MMGLTHPIRLTAILRKEDDQWDALCLELDIAAHGDTDEEAFASLKYLTDQYLRHMFAQGKGLHEVYRQVPPDALAEFLGNDDRLSTSRLVKREIETARFVYA